MKHIFSRLTATAAVCSMLMGTAASAEEVTWTGWLHLFDITQPVIENLEKQYEAKNPDVDFVRNDVPFEHTIQQATSSHLAGNLSDIIQMMAVHVPVLASADALEPLNDYFTEEELNAIPESTRQAVSEDGKLYSMPWLAAPILMFRNRNLLEAAGIDPDTEFKDWGELKEAMLKVCALPTTDAGKVYGFAMRSDRSANSAQWTIPIIYGHGGDVVDADGNASFNTPENRAAYQWVKDLADADCIPTGLSIAESRNLMGEGRAAFILEGPWGKGMLLNMSGNDLDTGPTSDLWVSMPPAGPDGSARTIGNPHQMAISATATDKERAADVIRFATTDPEFVYDYFKRTSFLTSANIDLLKSGPMGEDEYIQVFVDALPRTYDNPMFHPKFNSMLDELVEGLQEVIAGRDPEEALADVDKRVERLTRR